MKNIFLFLLILSQSLLSFGQKKEIDKLKNLIKKDAFKTIIIGDSLLHNANLSNYEVAKVKYYIALAYQTNKNYKKAIKQLCDMNIIALHFAAYTTSDGEYEVAELERKIKKKV